MAGKSPSPNRKSAAGVDRLNRTVRIFLSSTFRDFGEERDLLVRRVFPGLRAKLKDRFVELVDVDLRWGITVEQAERGEVLPICLVEIERARPFFVGMLGEQVQTGFALTQGCFSLLPRRDVTIDRNIADHEVLVVNKRTHRGLDHDLMPSAGVLHNLAAPSTRGHHGMQERRII